MTSDPLDPATAEAGPEAPLAPLAGTRSQAMQRLQVGLFGIASMILLVGLANIIMNSARQNQAQVVAEAAPADASEPKPAVRDPLADAGVVPDLPSRQAESSAVTDGNVPPSPQP